MSQEKVNRYKEAKANRKQAMKKQKMENTMWKIGGSLVGLIIIGWVGFSAVNTIEARKAAQPPVSTTYEVNADALTDYLTDITVEDAE